MEFCTYCGARLDAGVSFCPNCGAKVERSESFAKSEPIDSAFTSAGGGYSAPSRDHTPSTGAAILSCIFPIIGLIMWLVWKDEKPGKANSALKGLFARLCFSVPIVGVILYFVWKTEKPDFAKIGLIFGIIGFVLGIVCYLIYGIAFAMLELSSYGAYETYAAIAGMLI
ncbi:MAG: zinc ribbon domain-containing protein [Clostridia bacterium]|nr:zinc ribbon domain-containing protein [Clostridia bacterium]